MVGDEVGLRERLVGIGVGAGGAEREADTTGMGVGVATVVTLSFMPCAQCPAWAHTKKEMPTLLLLTVTIWPSLTGTRVLALVRLHVSYSACVFTLDKSCSLIQENTSESPNDIISGPIGLGASDHNTGTAFPFGTGVGGVGAGTGVGVGVGVATISFCPSAQCVDTEHTK